MNLAKPKQMYVYKNALSFFRGEVPGANCRGAKCRVSKIPFCFLSMLMIVADILSDGYN